MGSLAYQRRDVASPAPTRQLTAGDPLPRVLIAPHCHGDDWVFEPGGPTIWLSGRLGEADLCDAFAAALTAYNDHVRETGGSDVPEIQMFGYGQHEVRTILVDGAPWFVAADVCAVLEIGNPRQAVSYLDDDEVRKAPVTTNDGSARELPTNIISEAGLYSLILRSRKPEAKAFKRWVTHEVLPALRRTGTYTIPTQQTSTLPDITTPEGVLAMAEQFAATARQLVAERAKVAELEPPARSWHTLAAATGDFSVADAAKILSRDPNIRLGRDRLFTILRGLRWCYRQTGDGRNRAYQTAVEAGRLSELPSSHYHPRTGELVLDAPQVRVTVKGLGWLHRHLGGVAPLALPETAEPLPLG